MRISKKIVITLSVVLLLIIINLCNNANAVVDGGNSLANATQITSATTKINLGASYFKFIPGETQVYTIKTSNAVKGSDEYFSSPDTFASLCDSSNNIITTGINGGSGYDYADWGCQDGGGDGENFLFTCSLTARQTYYIYIQDWNMSGSAPFNTCDLEITGGGLISPPTDIAITASSINATATGNDVTVGTLSSTDPDAGDTFTYSIQGGANAGSFNILGNVLRTNTVLAGGSYNLTIRSTDNAELYYDKEFTIIVNGKPTDIAITASSINATDTGNNATVGTLSSTDPNAGNTFTYSIQGGDGAGSFNISGAVLRTNAVLAAGSYNLTIRSTDNTGLYYDKAFTVIVNGAPTDIAITASSINATDTGSNTTVGTLSSTDPNAGNTFTYSIQGGAGAGSFNILGTVLRTNNSLAAGSYSLTIRSTDNTGLYYDKPFIISVVSLPTILSSTVAANNAYIDVTFNTPVRGAGDGTTLIDPAKFSANFLVNGGTATGVTISDIKKTDGETVETATAIDGTETTVRFFLTVTATPNGAETIEIRPANGISVYNVMGTAMTAVQTGGIKNLKDLKSPIIQRVERTSNNTSITVILSENCTNIDKANDGGFKVEETGTPAKTYVVSAISQGSDARHVILTVADISASYKKGVTVKYTAGGNGTIQDIAGNIMATDSTGKAINAWRKPSTNDSTSTTILSPTPTSSTTPSPTPTTTTGPVSVDNKVPVKATVVTKEVEGKKVTTVTIDNELDNEIKKSGNNATVIIDLTKIEDKSDVAIVQLNGQTLKEMENKEVVLEIKTESATYTLPASQINIDSVSDKLGKDVKLKDIVVDVKIAVPSQETAKIVEATAKNKNYTVVVKPIDFNITCKNGEKTIEVSKFNGYVERMLAVPEGVDPSKIATGIVLNKDGTFSHVPTTVTKDNNRHYAKINSLTNSTYSVIWNPRTFKDVEKHWAKDSVNDMGSRLVIEGVGGDNFAPDKNITRAEFASIVVKALGLMRPGTGKDTYTDVTKADWYYDAVSIASEYGIINGYGKGKFGPTDKITREQAAAMITRAAKITGLKSQLKEGEAENLLSVFKDTAGLSSWSTESLAACVKSGMISGKNSITLAPKDFTTRAEVAVIVKRLLQKSNLIN